MDNLILTPKTYAKLTLMNLGTRDLHVCRNMSHEVTKEFAQKNNKVGASVMVRKPQRFSVKKGLVYVPQPIADTATPVTVSQVAQVGYDWDSIEQTLGIRTGAIMNEKQLAALDNLYAGPASIALASTINAEAATYVADNTFNSVGTPGVAPTTQATYLAAGDLLVAQGLPNEEQKNLVLVTNRRMSSAFVNGTVGYFNPQTAISEQLERGEIVKRLMGYKIVQDQTINRHTVGTYSGTPLVNNGAGVVYTSTGGNNGTSSIPTDGWGSGVSALNLGEKFMIGSATSATVGGVNSVHPQTKVDTGYQQQFTVLARITDTTGAMTILCSPAITPTSIDPQYANVTGGAVDNAIITVVGTTGATGDQGLLMHPDSFAFVSVPLDGPGSGLGVNVENVTDPDTGISIQMMQAFEARTHTHIHGLWVLYDFSPLYRELSCVVQA